MFLLAYTCSELQVGYFIVVRRGKLAIILILVRLGYSFVEWNSIN